MIRARAKRRMMKHNPALHPKLSAQLKHQPFLSSSSSSTHHTSQRCHPHHPETEVAHAHPRANQNHQEDSAGKTKARAQTTPSPATLMIATVTMLHPLAVHHRLAIAIDIVIARPDVMAETAIVLGRRGETTVIDTETEVREDARPDVREEEGMREKRRGRKTGPKIRRRRRSPRLLRHPVVRSL